MNETQKINYPYFLIRTTKEKNRIKINPKLTNFNIQIYIHSIRTIGSVTLLRSNANIHISHKCLIVVQVISLSKKRDQLEKEAHLCERKRKRKKMYKKTVQSRFIAVANGEEVCWACGTGMNKN